MTFEEWYKSYTDQGYQVSKAGCLAAWNAAKEDSKPVARVSYSQLLDEWCVYNRTGQEIKDGFVSKTQGTRWAIENGYRVEES